MANPRIEEVVDDEPVNKTVTAEEEGSDSDDGSDLEVGEGEGVSGGTQIVRKMSQDSRTMLLIPGRSTPVTRRRRAS